MVFARGMQSAGTHVNFTPALMRLWNPLTGSVVSVLDPTGEMRDVGMLYDGTNMWANVQSTGQPWEMRWELGRRGDWRPFFGDVLRPKEIGTLQVRCWRAHTDAQPCSCMGC